MLGKARMEVRERAEKEAEERRLERVAEGLEEYDVEDSANEPETDEAVIEDLSDDDERRKKKRKKKRREKEVIVIETVELDDLHQGVPDKDKDDIDL